LRPSWRSMARRTVARACSLGARRRDGLRILTYHRVNDHHPHDRLTVHPTAFAAQMEFLSHSRRPVLPLGDALTAIARGVPLEAGAVALTFDDGYLDNFTDALPILERFRLPASFFVVTGLMDTNRPLDRYRGCCESDRMLTWDQVRRLQDRGHTIGGHGRTHRELALLDEAEAREEAVGCASDLEARLGERPALFCYPRGSENALVRRVVREAGFRGACTVRPGPNSPGTDPLALSRTEVSGDDTLPDFRLKLEGTFDAWHRLVQAGGRSAR